MSTMMSHVLPGPSFTCPCCGATSYNLGDIAQRYCGKCNWWTGDPGLGGWHLAGRCPYRTEGAQGCVFCGRVDRGEYDEELSLPGSVAVFEPLKPVTPGHLLAIPFRHVRDAFEEPHVTGYVMEHAARLGAAFSAGGGGLYQANLITSIGPDATQSVFHLHVHLTPRRPDDNLALPWTGQAEREGRAS